MYDQAFLTYPHLFFRFKNLEEKNIIMKLSPFTFLFLANLSQIIDNILCFIKLLLTVDQIDDWSLAQQVFLKHLYAFFSRNVSKLFASILILSILEIPILLSNRVQSEISGCVVSRTLAREHLAACRPEIFSHPSGKALTPL